MSESSRAFLLKSLIALAFVMQVGLACYVIWNSSDPEGSAIESTVQPATSFEASKKPYLEEMYKEILLHETRIDASKWEVGSEFFKILKDRKHKDVVFFNPSHRSDDSVFEYLREFPITELMIINTGVTHACLKDIVQIKTLETLEIGQITLTPSDVEALANLPHFNHLRAFVCGLTDPCLKAVAGHNFRYLRINNNGKLTDEGVAYLNNEPDLVEIGLGANQVTDRSAEILARMPSLDLVELYQDRITDKALPQFEGLSKLVRLDLRQTLITDKGLAQFNPPPSLKGLDLGGCKGLTKAGVDDFRRSHPKLEIHY